ncbi:reverse transcriptase domain-containing protein [Tanacetum coccineum]
MAPTRRSNPNNNGANPNIAAIIAQQLQVIIPQNVTQVTNNVNNANGNGGNGNGGKGNGGNGANNGGCSSAKTVALTPNSAIVQIDVDDNFVINSTHLKMIWEYKFDGYLWADPQDHICEFLAICDMFKYGKAQSEAAKLLIFPFSLCDKAKSWFNKLNEESITSWEQIRRAFIKRFFSPSLFNRLLHEIRNFSQNERTRPTLEEEETIEGVIQLTPCWMRVALKTSFDGILKQKDKKRIASKSRITTSKNDRRIFLKKKRVGAGTNPLEGAVLGLSLLQYFAEAGALLTMATTIMGYHETKGGALLNIPGPLFQIACTTSDLKEVLLTPLEAFGTILNLLLNREQIRRHLDDSHFIRLLGVLSSWADIKENLNCLPIVTLKGGHLGWVAGENAPLGQKIVSGNLFSHLMSAIGGNIAGLATMENLVAHAKKRSKLMEQRDDAMVQADALDQWADEYLRKADAYGWRAEALVQQLENFDTSILLFQTML